MADGPVTGPMASSSPHHRGLACGNSGRYATVARLLPRPNPAAGGRFRVENMAAQVFFELRTFASKMRDGGFMTAIPLSPSDHSLADVMPSVAASLGVDTRNPLKLEPAGDTVLVLIDGMGAELIRQYADQAPTLSAMTTSMISAGFPATTATSLTSLAVGTPCSRHGIVGYSFRINDADGPPTSFNPLRWTLESAGGASALDRFPPRTVQQQTSVLELLDSEGVDVNYVMREDFRESGLTRAASRAQCTVAPLRVRDSSSCCRYSGRWRSTRFLMAPPAARMSPQFATSPTAWHSI